jgi:hypothetical protein
MSQSTTVPAATASAGSTAPVVPCPKCKQPLVDPKSLGWCKACGYCKSLAEAPIASASDTPVHPSYVDDWGEAGRVLSNALPMWFWIAFVGVVVIAVGGVAYSKYARPTEFQRAVVATVGILGGLACMLVGQFIALIRIAPEDATLGFRDALLPFRLYPLLCARLPRLQGSLYMGVWGAAAILTGLLLVGGVSHWLIYLPGHPNGPRASLR